MNGKGSKPRPLSISKQEFDAKYDAIFGKKPAIEIEHTGEISENENWFLKLNQESNKYFWAKNTTNTKLD